MEAVIRFINDIRLWLMPLAVAVVVARLAWEARGMIREVRAMESREPRRAVRRARGPEGFFVSGGIQGGGLAPWRA